MSFHQEVHQIVYSCVKIILHTPSQLFFHSLSLMNLDIVILEYVHDVSSYMVV